MSDDDAITPDSISNPNPDGDPDDARSAIDQLAEGAVDLVLGLLRRANALAGAVLIFSVVACIGGYLLGIAALGGGLGTAWIILGGLFAVWAIGAVLVAMWRLRAVRRGSGALVDEVRTLIGGDVQSEQTVIETIEVTEDRKDDGIVQISRQFFSLRDLVDGHTSNFTQLSLALSSITTFPGFMALATVIGLGFAGLSLIFVLVLIF